MRIGCDLDGVIIDHSQNHARLLAKRGFGSLSSEALQHAMLSQEYVEFKNELYGAISLGALEMKGSKVSLMNLLDKGHELHLISRRNKDRQFALQWLKEKGFEEVFTETQIHFVAADQEKDIVCRRHEIDIHIDDSPAVLDILTKPKHRILFAPSSQSCSSATYITDNWCDIYSHICDVENIRPTA